MLSPNHADQAHRRQTILRRKTDGFVNFPVSENHRPLYDAITKDLTDALQPVGDIETDHFNHLRNARFLMERITALQDELNHQLAPEAQQQHKLLDRYLRVAKADYGANLKVLQLLQSARQS